MNTPTFLMCEPAYFGVSYVINPWMASHVNQVDVPRAQQQWQDFYHLLGQHACVSLVTPSPQLPDFVFTANAGLIHKKRCLLSHFRHPERQAEEPFYKKWFVDHDYEIFEFPADVYFEGEGDALFQPGGQLIWMGYGIRSDLVAEKYLHRIFNLPVAPLKLVNDHFYHLDTCFFPLRHGYVMYYPAAFDRYANQTIEAEVPLEKRIQVSEADAHRFACNAILIPKTNHAGIIIMNDASPDLKKQLTALGYEIIIQCVDEFMKAGGANKCLTLTL